MSVYTLRLFITLNDIEINTVNRTFNSLVLAENTQTELTAAADKLGILNKIRFTIVETIVEG